METPDPAGHPQIVLDGKPYTVKFDNSAFVTLHEMGLEMEELAKKDEQGNPIQLKGAAAVERALKLIAAGISHQVDLTPKQIGRMKGASDPADLTGLFFAINEALVKVAGRAAATTAPQTMPQPLPN